MATLFGTRPAPAQSVSGSTSFERRVEIFGDANVKKALGEDGDAPVSGSLGVQYYGIDKIRTGFAYYRMGGSIDSFSHGQIIATIGLEATLNSGPLR